MKAEVLSIGSELTTGRNLDTNSRWLAVRLGELGAAVAFHATVGDDLDDNVDAFRTALRRADVVVASGGLGPTQDDLTREVLARVAGVELVEDAASLEQIRAMFARRGREMPERNRVQAQFPAGAAALFNRLGTAPGVALAVGGKVVYALPGVPSEMKVMFDEQVAPRLRARGGLGEVLLQRKINCFGEGESAVEQRLLDLTRRDHVPEVGITASDAVISLRVFARGATPEAALAQAAPVEAVIRERLGDLVFGENDDDLQDAVVRLLHERRKTLGTAEGVTAGLVAQRLGRVPGASAWFRGGLVLYGNAEKVHLGGVPPALIEEHGAVSAEVAAALAVGGRTRLGVDLCVGTVGVAGPAGGTAEKPVGTVFVALAHAGGTAGRQFSWVGTRDEVMSRTSKLALDLVRRHLLSAGR